MNDGAVRCTKSRTFGGGGVSWLEEAREWGGGVTIAGWRRSVEKQVGGRPSRSVGSSLAARDLRDTWVVQGEYVAVNLLVYVVVAVQVLAGVWPSVNGRGFCCWFCCTTSYTDIVKKKCENL